MLIQPYVENAIKHGLLHKKNDRLVKIDFVIDENILTVTVDDNGIGRVKAEELNKIKKEKFASFSTKANQQRLEIINRSVGRNMGVKIIDKYDQNNQPEGTQVILTIPIN